MFFLECLFIVSTSNLAWYDGNNSQKKIAPHATWEIRRQYIKCASHYHDVNYILCLACRFDIISTVNHSPASDSTPKMTINRAYLLDNIVSEVAKGKIDTA